ncbi:hypothetical protein EV126DRAFT_256310 [Verticillium dahliae]|nr:hypothetical protein EV126DRAFT_256310 [Verticillium dahliae]
MHEQFGKERKVPVQVADGRARLMADKSRVVCFGRRWSLGGCLELGPGPGPAPAPAPSRQLPTPRRLQQEARTKALGGRNIPRMVPAGWLGNLQADKAARQARVNAEPHVGRQKPTTLRYITVQNQAPSTCTSPNSCQAPSPELDRSATWQPRLRKSSTPHGTRRRICQMHQKLPYMVQARGQTDLADDRTVPSAPVIFNGWHVRESPMPKASINAARHLPSKYTSRGTLQRKQYSSRPCSHSLLTRFATRPAGRSAAGVGGRVGRQQIESPTSLPFATLPKSKDSNRKIKKNKEIRDEDHNFEHEWTFSTERGSFIEWPSGAESFTTSNSAPSSRPASPSVKGPCTEYTPPGTRGRMDRRL